MALQEPLDRLLPLPLRLHRRSWVEAAADLLHLLHHRPHHQEWEEEGLHLHRRLRRHPEVGPLPLLLPLEWVAPLPLPRPQAWVVCPGLWLGLLAKRRF